MKSPESFRDKFKYISKECDGHIDLYVWQFFVAIAAGIGLFIATGLAGRLIAAIAKQSQINNDGVVIIGSVPISDLLIGIGGSALLGGVIGVALYYIGLFVYYWIKTYCAKK